MLIHGWGAYPKIDAKIYNPKISSEIKEITKFNATIPRGMGKSYGDSSLSSKILSTLNLNKVISFNSESGILVCESGLIISDILNDIIAKGWFLPVTPGTAFLTIGGCLASDVHGKNHHIDGSISNFVDSFTILLGNGEIIECSRLLNNDLFTATCGGMGLTGIVLTIKIKLKKINSNFIKNKTIKSRNIKELLWHIEENKKSPYSVAWIDSNMGTIENFKSVLFLGDHENSGFISENSKQKEIYVSENFPSFILNKYSMKIFNKLYYLKQKQYFINKINLKKYFYPLDRLKNWNNLYGQRGFLQYQFVIPKENALSNLNRIFNIFNKNNEYSFLTTLKSMGDKNKNLLSFPQNGYTVTQDFKYNKNIAKLIQYADTMIADFGGKIYLTKDALLKEKIFKKTYINWYEFENIRDKYHAIGSFQSFQSKRIGLQ